MAYKPPTPRHANTWQKETIPADQLRREIQYLYSLIEEMQKKLVVNGIN